MEASLERWGYSLETGEEGGKVSIEIVKVDEFNYLESNIHSNVQCTRKVMKSVQAGCR